MALSQVTFDKRKWILKFYWKTENVTEVKMCLRFQDDTCAMSITNALR